MRGNTCVYAINILSLRHNIDDMRIKYILKEKGMTTGELAQRAGMHQPEISRAMNGNPTVATLAKIASALGVSVGDLFERSIDETPTGICPHCGNPIKIKLE